MKVKASDNDTAEFKKISIIDQLGASMSYNMAAETRPWSDLNTRLRLKITKSYTFSMNAVFATYAYELDENGRPYVGTRTEYSKGRFGRFQGMSQNVSYTITPDKIRNLFRKKKNKDDEDTPAMGKEDTGVASHSLTVLLCVRTPLELSTRKRCAIRISTAKTLTSQETYASLTVGTSPSLRVMTLTTTNFQ